MEVRGGRGRSALYIGCVYMPSTSVAAVDAGYVRLKEDVLTFKRGRWCCLVISMLESVDLDDVIGMFGKDACNASGTF